MVTKQDIHNIINEHLIKEGIITRPDVIGMHVSIRAIMDSLDLVYLIGDLEGQFNITLQDKDTYELDTINDLVELVFITINHKRIIP